MQRRKLPIGKSTFRVIRDPKQDWVYVDKTEMAYQLAVSDTYYFLSRPRRFGKSLFLDTLSEIFKGSKHLFEGLYIYDKWDWKQQYPVIKLDMSIGQFSTDELIQEAFDAIIGDNAKQYDIPLEKFNGHSPGMMLRRLITELYNKYNQQVVILIDEYDKPILDSIGKTDKSHSLKARDILKDFYSAIKANDQYLKFVFITGVSKFSKLNLFSGLNNLKDITLSKSYATITGYTQADLEREFSEYLEGVDLEEVKKWYNGYNYFGEPIYNPFDILLFLSEDGEFNNYWWETGNPSFLIEKLKEGDYFLPDLENIEVSQETLNTFDVEHIDLVALLWQTGYLTFDKKINRLRRVLYKLKVPNLEIQFSLNELFLGYLTNLKSSSTTYSSKVVEALLAADIELFRTELEAMFAAIPYENYVKNNISHFEGYYASVVFAFLSSLDFEVKTEDSTNRGRIDMTLIGPDQIFILEFKVDQPEEAALQQIESKKYYEKYLNEEQEIFLVGIHFSSEERNIVGMEWRSLERHSVY